VTAFAVAAGVMFGLKNPTEAEFLRLDAFGSLESEINRHGFQVTDPKPVTNQLCDAKDYSQGQKLT